METEFFHLCPVCGNKVFHKNQNSLVDFNRRLKKGKTKGLCRHCVTQDENWVLQHSILQKGHFARSNYDIWLEKYGQEEADRRRSEFISKQKLVYSSKTDEEKQEHVRKSVHFGTDNGMYGKSFYQRWVELYGVEEADRRLSEYKRKHSESSRGEKNPWYGKNAPIGSGNGWSGWYKGWYFRSLKELTYMIDVIEANGFQWQSLESKEFDIHYEMDGEKHVYHGDFLVNGNVFVEIKPKRLMNTKINVAKRKAALEFCRVRGFEYRMVDVKNISEDRLIGLFEDGQVTFIEKYSKRIVEKCRLKKQRQ